MKVWYHAVCDKHKEHCRIFVSNPSCTAQYLPDRDVKIQAFLGRHYGCKLRLIHNDLDLDVIFTDKYKDWLE